MIMNIKKDKIGTMTSSPLGGMIRIKEEHAKMFFKAGRFDLLEGVEPKTGKLIPLENLTVKELSKKAKDMEGWKPKMKKADLIVLIRAASSSK